MGAPTASSPVTAAGSPCGLSCPSGSMSTGRQPTVGVLKVAGACGCSRLPDRKAPPISVPAGGGHQHRRRVGS